LQPGHLPVDVQHLGLEEGGAITGDGWHVGDLGGESWIAAFAKLESARLSTGKTNFCSGRK
jgi:hypothetical protein